METWWKESQQSPPAVGDTAWAVGALVVAPSLISQALEEDRYPSYKREKLAGMGFEEVPFTNAEGEEQKSQEE